MKVENLDVAYGRVRAVRNVSFNVRRGELVALVGPNGAGKSSLVGGIMGWTKVLGSVEFEGNQIAGASPEQVMRAGLSLVPEGRRVFGSLTVEENLALAASTVLRGSRRTDAVKAEFERFPALGRLRGRHASKLSGGEQQQLSIARALIASPKLLMLDEPSFGLAPLVVEQVLDIVRNLADSGVTVLLIEQNALAAIKLAERAYSMQNGELHELDLESTDAVSQALENSFFGSAR